MQNSNLIHELLAIAEQELEQREKLKTEAGLLSGDLPAFVKAAWSILEPVTPLSWNWHLDLICEYLTIVKEKRLKEVFGADCEGVIFNVPPRTMKSLLITVMFPCWLWASDPARRWMFASYAEKLSTQHSVYRRNVMQSTWYQERWGHVVQFAKDQNQKTQYENSARGSMLATAMGALATGFGGDVLVFDDPLNPEQALSEAERNAVNVKFDTTFRSRLNDPATGAKIIVMQRLHEDDLTGHVLSYGGTQWRHVKLPAIAEVDESWIFPISKRVETRKPDDLLWPERLSRPTLDAMKGSDGKVGMGSWAFAGQYQQNPAPLEGGLIKIGWASNLYKELPEKFDLMVQSWDCTFKDSDGSDFVAGQVWGKFAGKYYMLPYRTYERLAFGPTMTAIKACHAKFPRAHAILIEDKANGSAIISELQKEISGIIPINPEGGKMTRAQATSPVWESGSMMLPDPTVFDVPWLADYQHNICTFPKAAHDDDMDATSQALIYIRNKMGAGIMDFYRTQASQQKEAAAQSKGLPPKPGVRIAETGLTNVAKETIASGGRISCSKRQYPEIRQALIDIGSEEALREANRLDPEMSWTN